MIEVGMDFTVKKKVESFETAKSIGSGGLDVYSTPSMIALMEQSAFLCVEGKLDGNSTVGIKIDVDHLKAVKENAEVSATATLEEVDGKKLHFEVGAYSGGELIGKAKHTRYIINSEKFMSKLD